LWHNGVIGKETAVRYEMMLPYQIRQAIEEKWPVVLPLGVLEYHSEHLGVGMDTFAVDRSLALLEKEMNLVVLPAFYYGSASYCVAPAKGNGSVQVESENLIPFARDLFKSLLRIGFRNIHFIVHHQSENFADGMPTDLAFKTAAKQAIFEQLATERGEGWWGDESMADYYARHGSGDNPFNWIKGHPLMDQDIIARYDFDHAGIGETSLMMALCPESVDMARFDQSKWFSKTAKDASPEYGREAVRMILERLRRILK
jgi:creatinine amidohydrolase/Fe(II)-dependent formamide hydrolase-like protein